MTKYTHTYNLIIFCCALDFLFFFFLFIKVNILVFHNYQIRSYNRVFFNSLDIRNFQPPRSSITLASESDLQWKATNLALEIDGNFHYKYKKGM